jgi:hypothetical protein
MTEPETGPDRLAGSLDLAAGELERIAIRTRESGLTLSAWRLGVSSGKSEGAIFLVETPGGGTLFRGDGICLGWSQERLEETYRRLLPDGGDAEPSVGQLG